MAFLADRGEKPDLTLRALLVELKDRGMVVSYYALWHFLQHEGITFKKKPARTPNRTGLMSKGGVRRWKRASGVRSIRARLVFIDETWAKTNMTRIHGRCAKRPTPRRQSALRPMADPHLPGGFALRRPRPPPRVIDEPINGRSSLQWVQAKYLTLHALDVPVDDSKVFVFHALPFGDTRPCHPGP